MLAVVVLGCSTASRDPASPAQALRALIEAGDLAGADALIGARPADLDARRALDLAIRAGRPDAVGHFLLAAGTEAELDPDATTPLIRAVLDAPPAVRPAIVALLMQAGARPDRTDRYDRDARDYALLRNRSELLPLLDGTAGSTEPARRPAFAAWLGGDAAGARPVPNGDARPLARPAAGGAAPTASRSGAQAVAAGAPPIPRVAQSATPAGALAAQQRTQAARASLLMRLSPWRPAMPAGTVEVAALRFHGDGTADLLRHVPGTDRYDPMPRAYVAWTIEADRVRVAMVGEAFSALCAGSVTVAAAGSETLALLCQDLQPVAGARGQALSLDFARAMLVAPDAPRAPSIVAIARGLAPLPGEGDAGVAADAGVQRLAVSLKGAPPGAACRPARARPRAAQPQARVLGDWVAFDTRRFEAASPTAGRYCPQPVARDAAMKACREAAGRDGGACRSVGGCPIGQATALAGLPGVDAGWVACDADPAAARRRALAACRADLGCDCQLVALSGRNLTPPAPGASSCGGAGR